MSYNDWYHSGESWYSPLERKEEPASDCADMGKADEKAYAPPRRPRRRMRTVGLIILLVILITGSSLIFADKDGNSISIIWGSDSESPVNFMPDDFFPEGWDEEAFDESMPETWDGFIDSYFSAAESVTSQTNVKRTKLEEEFELVVEKAEGDPLTLQQLYKRCSPSIVAIYGYMDDSSGFYWGTGVVISENGLVITNNHIIEGCDSVSVKLHDNSEYEALLVGADAASDLALLKIDASGLTAASIGDSTALAVGDPVAAIGNPLGEEFRSTLTNGIISAIDRGMNYKGQSLLLLQTNTALNEGSSGGALFNMYGQVIGITNMKMRSIYSSIEGIGFAIPSATVDMVVNSLVSRGEVRGRPSLGITVGTIPEEAAEFYDIPMGLVISEIQEKSDANSKGLRRGDIITHVNFEPVTDSSQITAIRNTLEVGDIMMFTIWREGESFDVDIILKDTNDLY